VKERRRRRRLDVAAQVEIEGNILKQDHHILVSSAQILALST
jgi:hypothetical protein